jgi:hypothetical protein
MSAAPIELPPEWWSVASHLDEKLTRWPGDDGDRQSYDRLTLAWTAMSKAEQLQAWEALTDRGFYALADAFGHGLDFDAYESMKRDDYDGQEAEMQELRESITADIEEAEQEDSA